MEAPGNPHASSGQMGEGTRTDATTEASASLVTQGMQTSIAWAGLCLPVSVRLTPKHCPPGSRKPPGFCCHAAEEEEAEEEERDLREFPFFCFEPFFLGLLFFFPLSLPGLTGATLPVGGALS